MEVNLDEGTVVDTFTEKDTGPYLDRVRGSALEFCLFSYPVGCFCHSLQVRCHVLVADECWCLFGASENYKWEVLDVLRWRSLSRILKAVNTE